MKVSRRAQGFTLLELMTSIAITIIILLAVAAAFTATQTIYQREANQKTAVENGRVAASYIERVTRFLGYGIDPRFAIDLDATNLPGTTKSNFTGAASVTTAITGFVTDDFAFRYRDPTYLRRGTYDGTNVVIDVSAGGPATFGLTLQAGRLLQVTCNSGQAWVVLKTSAVMAPTATTVAAGSAAIAGDSTSFPAPTAPSCLTSTGARAPYITVVREIRLRVIPLGVAPNIRPFLVAYNSIADSVTGGATDYDPIAADIESFQVAYVMNRAPTGNPFDNNTGPATGDWVLGNATTDSVSIPAVTVPRPTYDSQYNDPARITIDPANTRAVVFSLGIRSLRVENRKVFAQYRLADDATAAILPDGYYHTAISTTVRTPNLLSRSVFVPPLISVKNPVGLNYWGG